MRHVKLKKDRVLTRYAQLAGGEGFEPSYLEPESSVLPLDDPPAALVMIQKFAVPDKVECHLCRPCS